MGDGCCKCRYVRESIARDSKGFKHPHTDEHERRAASHGGCMRALSGVGATAIVLSPYDGSRRHHPPRDRRSARGAAAVRARSERPRARARRTEWGTCGARGRWSWSTSKVRSARVAAAFTFSARGHWGACHRVRGCEPGFDRGRRRKGARAQSQLGGYPSDSAREARRARESASRLLSGVIGAPLPGTRIMIPGDFGLAIAKFRAVGHAVGHNGPSGGTAFHAPDGPRPPRGHDASRSAPDMSNDHRTGSVTGWSYTKDHVRNSRRPRVDRLCRQRQDEVSHAAGVAAVGFASGERCQCRVSYVPVAGCRRRAAPRLLYSSGSRSLEPRSCSSSEAGVSSRPVETPAIDVGQLGVGGPDGAFAGVSSRGCGVSSMAGSWRRERMSSLR
jgi:hypothetical protein